MGSGSVGGDGVRDYFRWRGWDQDGPGWTPSLPAMHMQDLAGCQPEASCHGGYSHEESALNCRPSPKCVSSAEIHGLLGSTVHLF